MLLNSLKYLVLYIYIYIYIYKILAILPLYNGTFVKYVKVIYRLCFLTVKSDSGKSFNHKTSHVRLKIIYSLAQNDHNKTLLQSTTFQPTRFKNLHGFSLHETHNQI
jgi:hypothetical protein